MYLERAITSRLLKLASTFPAVVLSGARQVGKSTLLRHVFGSKADIVVLDPVTDVENARRDPDLFLDNRRPPLVLDEIQYAPELVAAIKRRIDRDRSPGQYILTGSQQWGVLKSMSESLAGRAVFLDLEGFSLAELTGKAAPKTWLEAWVSDPAGFLSRPPGRLPPGRTLYEQIWRGFMPEAQFLDAEVLPDFHTAYQRTYVERDVRLLADISDFQLFGRFLRLATALTAQEINYSQLGRELGLTPQTAHRWLDILRSTFQWFELPAYSGNAVKRLSARPKGYASDTGLACALQAISSPHTLAGHPMLGALFETAVVAEIRKQASLLSPRPSLYHWRSHGGAEVDILIERDGVFFPIEVKARSHPDSRDTRGLSAFRKTYPRLRIAKGLIVAPTERLYPVSETDTAVPWDMAVL